MIASRGPRPGRPPPLRHVKRRSDILNTESLTDHISERVTGTRGRDGADDVGTIGFGTSFLRIVTLLSGDENLFPWGPTGLTVSSQTMRNGTRIDGSELRRRLFAFQDSTTATRRLAFMNCFELLFSSQSDRYDIESLTPCFQKRHDVC